jgi:hypothetical protein
MSRCTHPQHVQTSHDHERLSHMSLPQAPAQTQPWPVPGRSAQIQEHHLTTLH